MNLTDKTQLKALQAELTQAMLAVCEKHGLAVAPRGGTFTALQYVGKWTFTVKPQPGEKTVEQREFERDAALFNLKPEDYGRTITWGLTAFALRGISPRRSKFPVLVTRVSDGQAYELPWDALKQVQQP